MLGILVDAASGSFEMIPNGHPQFLTPAARKKMDEYGVRMRMMQDGDYDGAFFLAEEEPPKQHRKKSKKSKRIRRAAVHGATASQRRNQDESDDEDNSSSQDGSEQDEEEEDDDQSDRGSLQDKSFRKRVEEPTAESLGVRASDDRILTVRMRALHASSKGTVLPDLDEGTVVVGRERPEKKRRGDKEDDDEENDDAGDDEEQQGKVVVLRIAAIYWGLQTYINSLVGKTQASRRMRSRTASSHCYAVCEIVRKA